MICTKWPLASGLIVIVPITENLQTGIVDLPYLGSDLVLQLIKLPNIRVLIGGSVGYLGLLV